MNEAMITYSLVLVVIAIGFMIYINYQEKTQKDKKIEKKHH